MATLDTLHAARMGALKKGNSPSAPQNALEYRETIKQGSPEVQAFTDARKNAAFNRNRLGKLGGKSRRRRHKKTKKTHKRRRN